MTTLLTKNFQLSLPDFRSGPWHDLINNDLIRVDALIFGALSKVDTQPWVNNKLYGTGVTVIDASDASTWMASVNHTSAVAGTFLADRTAHPTYWVRLVTGFAPRGEWARNTHYFPYDLAYQTSQGVFALCAVEHVSNAAGTIINDAAMWSFLVDFHAIGLATALAVSYSNTTSGLVATNVQNAINELATKAASLLTTNNTQSADISALQAKDVVHETRMTTIESVDTAQAANLTSLNAFAAGPSFRGYILGLGMVWASTTTITVGAGAAQDSGNTDHMILTVAMTKTTAAFAAGTGNGGLNTGTIAVLSWYHWFLIKNGSSGAVDVMFSLSAVPALPTGFTLYRRIGSAKTNGSSQWVKFVSEGELFQWDVSTHEVTLTNPGTAALTRALNVPPARVRAIVSLNWSNVDPADYPAGILLSDLSVTDTAPQTGVANTSAVGFVPSAGNNGGCVVEVMTNTSSQIRVRVEHSGPTTAIDLAALGWWDWRGKNV